MYNVPAVTQWKQEVKDVAFIRMLQAGKSQFPIEAGVPIRVDYNFYLGWPKGTAKKRASTYAAHPQKPDLKNLLSHTEDALSEAGLWNDDNQVDELAMRKWRCPRDEARVEVEISW